MESRYEKVACRKLLVASNQLLVAHWEQMSNSDLQHATRDTRDCVTRDRATRDVFGFCDLVRHKRQDRYQATHQQLQQQQI